MSISRDKQKTYNDMESHSVAHENRFATLDYSDTYLITKKICVFYKLENIQEMLDHITYQFMNKTDKRCFYVYIFLLSIQYDIAKIGNANPTDIVVAKKCLDDPTISIRQDQFGETESSILKAILGRNIDNRNEKKGGPYHLPPITPLLIHPSIIENSSASERANQVKHHSDIIKEAKTSAVAICTLCILTIYVLDQLSKKEISAGLTKIAIDTTTSLMLASFLPYGLYMATFWMHPNLYPHEFNSTYNAPRITFPKIRARLNMMANNISEQVITGLQNNTLFSRLPLPSRVAPSMPQPARLETQKN